MDDLISRQAAVKALGEKPVAWSKGEYERGLQNQWGYDVSAIKQLQPAQPPTMHIIMETLAECGIYGEEATIKLIGTLKRIGRDDLLPPCVR